MSKNKPDNFDYKLLQSIINVFYLFIVQFQFEKYEVTHVFIQRNRSNKTVTCQFYETVKIDILTVLIKAVVFHHVGLSWMIETKYQYISAFYGYFN